MRILIAPLENFILGEKTFFHSDHDIGSTSIDVKSNENFKEGDLIVLGTIGSETAEIVQIDSLSSDKKKIDLKTNTFFKHSCSEPIQVLMFNQRKFYRSESPDSGYIHLSTEGSPVNIEVDVPEGTRFEDSSGTSEHYYKATYWNSYTSTETSMDDAISSKAGDSDHYTSIYKIRNEAGLTYNSYIGSDIIDGYRIEAEAQVDGSIANVYRVPLENPSKIIQHITTLLAAGHLLSKEYGLESDIDISKSGQRKIERAEKLLLKISEGELILLDGDGETMSRKGVFYSSGSNVYCEDRPDKGVLFNLEPEHFKMTDPEEPLSSSRRVKYNKK